MKKKILGILIAIAISLPSYASMIVSPTKREINVNKVRSNYATCSIEVKGDELCRNKIYRYRKWLRLPYRFVRIGLPQSL